MPILGEEISGLTHRPHDVNLLDLPLPLTLNLFFHRNDLVVTAIKGRPNQVVHAGIDDREFFLA